MDAMQKKADKSLYLCMEIGGTNLRYGVVTEQFELLDFEKIPSTSLSDAEEKDVYIEAILTPLMEKYGKESFCCIAMSLASLMNRERTICFNSPNIRGFDNLPLKSMLEKRLDLPVYMERDVNTALLYEVWKNKLDTNGILVGVYIGTGLGNAMCINGKIYTGHTGSSCELGHIPVVGLEEWCGCGKKGCIELKASGRVLALIAQEKYHCPVSEIFTRYGDRDDVREVVHMCAIAAASEITILDPVCMILGGGMTEIPDFPLQYFVDRVKENLRIPNPRESLNIIMASGDPQAGIVGAAIHADSLLKDTI